MPKWIRDKIWADTIGGYTMRAIREKCYGGIWAEGVHWQKAPDGRIFLNVAALDDWIENKFK